MKCVKAMSCTTKSVGVEVLRLRKLSGEINTSAWCFFNALAIDHSNHQMNKNGWRAGGNNTTGVTLELKIKDASNGLSKKKMNSCSGCVAAKRRNVSRVKRPIPSSWFFNKKRVLTAIFNVLLPPQYFRILGSWRVLKMSTIISS